MLGIKDGGDRGLYQLTYVGISKLEMYMIS